MSGPARITEIRTGLREIPDERRELCLRLSDLNDERERLLAELERLDRRAYREEAL